jgi:DNA-binding response OmpR family regulator
MRIIVIEDEAPLLRHIVSALKRHGHEAESQTDGASGLKSALHHPPELMILDLNLPGMDGFSVLEHLREVNTSTRVLILTAIGNVESRVKGLRCGADDYLTKPFSMEELLARVDALGRRTASAAAGESLHFADLSLDLRHRRVTRAGKTIALTPRELELLEVLMREPGRVFSRSELCERVWRRPYEYDTRTVEIFITRLRKKIDFESVEPLIFTERFSGYSIRQGSSETSPMGTRSA